MLRIGLPQLDLLTSASRAALGGAPSLYLDFLAMSARTLDSRITFSRGTNATLTDSTGRITYAPNNLLANSDSFDAAYWTKTNSSVSANVTTAPNGTFTADKLVENTAASVNHFMDGGANVVGIPIVYSVYVKAAGRSFLQLTGGGFGAQGNTAIFNLSNGTMFANFGNKGGIVDAGNGWYRCYIAFTPSTTGSIGLYMCDNTGNPSYTGDGTSGIFFWGAQLEQVTYQTTPSTYVATTSAAYYGPRFDYDPVTLAARGLLIEEQRTNLFTRSEEFDNAAWSKNRSSITANATTSPDGTADADKLVEDTSNNTHYLAQFSVNVTSGVSYTYTMYAKAAERTWAALRMETTNAAFNGGFANFNLSNGTVGSVDAGLTASITAAGNGWYRLSVTSTATATAAAALSIYLGTANNVVSYTGDGTSGIFLYGAQLEAGAFATSYIPTTTATATRNADVATMTGTNFSTWYNPSQGTLVASSSLAAGGANTAALTGPSTNIIRLGGGLGQVFVNGSLDANLGSAATGITNQALAYATNDMAMSVNGAAVTTDTSCLVPSGINALQLQSGVNTYANGHLRVLAYFNTRLPNSQLQTLTAPSLSTTLNLDFLNGNYNVGF